MNTGSLYSALTGKINHVRRKEHGIAVQAGLINALTATLAVWIIAVSIEAIGELEPSGRTILFWSAVALNAALALWSIAPAIGRYLGVINGQDDDTIARRVGRKIPAVGDHLINTLQLYRTAHTGTLATGYSPELLEASIAAQGEPLRQYDYTVIIERDHRKRALLMFLSAALTVSTLFLSFPATYHGALDRLANHTIEYVRPAPFSLTIAPGDRQLIRGDSVEIIVTATGIPPRSLRLSLQTGEEAPEEMEIRSDSNGTFRYAITGIKATTSYRAYSGPIRTPEHTLRVVERPDVRLLRVSTTSPAYTGRGLERLPDNVGDVSGMRGTAVSVQITTTIQTATATLVQIFPRGARLASAAHIAVPPTSYDTVRIPMKIDGTSASAGFRLTRDGEYFIELVSPDGIGNSAPVHYSMGVSTDAPPSITLVQPQGSIDIDQTMLLPTQVRIADDYGFSRLQIMYRLSASKYARPMKEFRPHTIPLPRSAGTVADVPYIWDMTRMDMVPEDEVEIYFEVYDNDAVAGPKVARTAVITVRFPSLEEVLRQAEQGQAQANADLEKVLKQAQDARKEMDGLNRELMKQLAQNKQQANWQDKQKLEQVMRQHEQMEQKLEQIADNLKQITEKLQQAKAISPETLQKYQELQKLFEEIKNPALMEQMRKLQQDMEKMTPEQLAEAMKNYKFNEEQFRQSIERTMNILKRMQTEQKVDEMIRRAEELAKQQERLNEQMRQTDPNDKAMQQALAERQRDLAKDAERMKQEADELAKQMGEQEDMPTKEMQEAQQSLEQNGPQQPMEQAGEKMKQGDMQQAQQQGEQAQKSAENFRQKMESVRKKMQENSQKNVVNKMKKAMQDLLELSKRQEELKRQTEQTQPNSPQFRDLAQQQAQMKEQMENIANQMMGLGQKSFAVTPEMGKEMGDAIRQMQGATQSLEQRDGPNASQQEGGAMSSMNNAAKMMAEAIQQMQNGQGQGMGMGMGMQQRLQQAAAQQQMINQAMQQQMGQGQGQGEQGQEGEGKEGEGKEGKGKGKGKNGKNGQDGEDGSNGEGPEMRRLERQQQDVKKSIDQLNKETRESGGTRKNMLGDLERAAREIDEVLADIRSGQVTPETLQRQERILSRLLDATRSQRERDFEKERESKPGVDVLRQSPPELRFPNQQQVPAGRDELRQRQQGYTKDYEYMIRRYFDALGRGAAPSSLE